MPAHYYDNAGLVNYFASDAPEMEEDYRAALHLALEELGPLDAARAVNASSDVFLLTEAIRILIERPSHG